MNSLNPRWCQHWDWINPSTQHPTTLLLQPHPSTAYRTFKPSPRVKVQCQSWHKQVDVWNHNNHAHHAYYINVEPLLVTSNHCKCKCILFIKWSVRLCLSCWLAQISLYVNKRGRCCDGSVQAQRVDGISEEHNTSVVLTAGSMQGISGGLMRLQNSWYAFDQEKQHGSSASLTQRQHQGLLLLFFALKKNNRTRCF